MTKPVIQTKGSAGADLVSAERVNILPGDSVVISTGYVYDVDGTSLVKGRSGLAFRHDVVAFEGLIDRDFVGQEVKVKLFNLGVNVIIIEPGDRIAQLVVINDNTAKHFQTLDNEREGGFGSTQ